MYMVTLDTPLQGISQAQDAFDQAASKVVQATTPNQPQQSPQDQVSLSGAMVSMLQASNSFQANVKAFQVSDDMQKSLLNIFA
jgi:flagellar basal body rod protein FlgC